MPWGLLFKQQNIHNKFTCVVIVAVARRIKQRLINSQSHIIKTQQRRIAYQQEPAQVMMIAPNAHNTWWKINEETVNNL